MVLTVRSLDWAQGGRIPARYTADGEDRSPSVEFGSVPDGVRSFALVFDDPDAPVGTWVHWVIYDLPGTLRKLAEGIPRTETLPGGARQGRNSWDEVGYQGPSPPPGKPHRYILHLYALTGPIGAEPGLTASALEKLVQPRVIASAEYLGTYGRTK